MLGRLAEHTQQYYDRFISIICTETVQTQDLRLNLAPVGRPRTTVYKLSVSREPGGKRENEFRVERTLQSVNGRPARKNQRAECTDPKTGTPEPPERVRVTWEGNCFEAEGGGDQGRVWFDPVTYDIAQVDVRGVPSMRISQTLGNYRRFLTKSEIRASGF